MFFGRHIRPFDLRKKSISILIVRSQKGQIMKFTYRKRFSNVSLLTLSFTMLLFLISGCDEGGGITVPSGVTSLSVSAKNTNINNPGSSLVITEAKALISNMKLENGGGNNEQIPVNPFVVNFNMDGSLQEMTSGYIIRDNYVNIKFELHKPVANETVPDTAFNTGPLDNQRFTFIIKGTYNGNSFVYKSLADANIIISFSAAQNINLANMNITMLFNIPDWFKNGAAIMNPSDPQNAVLIDANIKNSFKQAFMDNNKDGNPDN